MVIDDCYLWLNPSGFFVTSSQATLEETQRGIATVNRAGQADDADTAGPAFQVSDKSNRTWLIPLAQCSTWLVSDSHLQPVKYEY